MENHSSQGKTSSGREMESPASSECSRACQICGGQLVEIRAKLVCERCHTIWETCCEGGRG
jgi:hypothetical protein